VECFGTRSESPGRQAGARVRLCGALGRRTHTGVQARRAHDALSGALDTRQRRRKTAAAVPRFELQRGLAAPPIAMPPVAQYRRFLWATLGAETLMFLYLGYRRSRNTAAFLKLHRAAVYRGPAVQPNGEPHLLHTGPLPFALAQRTRAGETENDTNNSGRRGNKIAIWCCYRITRDVNWMANRAFLVLKNNADVFVSNLK
jgi:hypothetical protein